MIKRYRSMYIKALRRRANLVEKHPWLIILPILGAAFRTHRLWYGTPAKEPRSPAYKAWMDKSVFEPLAAALGAKSKVILDGVADGLKQNNKVSSLKDRTDSLAAQGAGSKIPEHLRKRLQRLADEAPPGAPADVVESLRGLLSQADRPTTY